MDDSREAYVVCFILKRNTLPNRKFLFKKFEGISQSSITFYFTVKGTSRRGRSWRWFVRSAVNSTLEKPLLEKAICSSAFLRNSSLLQYCHRKRLPDRSQNLRRNFLIVLTQLSRVKLQMEICITNNERSLTSAKSHSRDWTRTAGHILIRRHFRYVPC